VTVLELLVGRLHHAAWREFNYSRAAFLAYVKSRFSL